MNNKNTFAINGASQAPEKISSEPSGLIFKPVPGYETTDGVHSQWPKVMATETKKEVPPSTAAKGDDGLMSTPAKPVKP